jgi:uncharacterized protein YrrD
MLGKITLCPGSQVTGSFMALALCFLLSNPLRAEEMNKGGKNGPEGLQVRKIVDHVVHNPQGEFLGVIDDLVLKRNGMVKTAILDTGGVADIGEKQIGLPFSSLQITSSENGKMDISFKAAKEELKERPAFDYSQKDLETGYYYIRPYTYGYYPYGPHGPYIRRHRGPYSPPYAGPQPDYWPWPSAYYPNLMLAGVILGRPVIDDRGEQLGSVYDLIISPKGRVEHIILDLGGVFGPGHLVALPFQPLGFTNWGVLYHGITEKQIQNLPPIQNRQG